MPICNEKHISLCACSSRSFIDAKKVEEVAVTLNNRGYSVDVIPDLCQLFSDPNSNIEEISGSTVIACYERCIKSQFAWRKLSCSSVYDIRSNSAEDVLSNFEALEVSSNNNEDTDIANKIMNLPNNEGTDSWYPVIDKDKCTECGKCFDFCLFGVYSNTDNKILVSEPANCKNNCPACARMCPSKAIIFPKYLKSPINGGDDIEETFDSETIDKMYNERLKYKLKQRRISILKK